MFAGFISFGRLILGTLRDLTPIILVIAFFQIVVLEQPFPNLEMVLGGLLLVMIGLALFIQGLEMGLFPLGESMATAFARKGSLAWLLAFAFALGFGVTVAEPALIAVAGEAASAAVGVSMGVALGCFRIVTGTPLPYYIMLGYGLVIVQTVLAPKAIIPLAFDTGGVATSTVTVPLVAALGLGLASTIPGRSPLIDGFGLIAFASLFPMITVMGYAQFSAWRHRRAAHGSDDDGAKPKEDVT